VAAQHVAQRGGDLALGQDSRGHLVEEGLEQMVVAAVEQDDVDVGETEQVCRREAPETSADDDDAVSGARVSWRRVDMAASGPVHHRAAG
jgi:hypothetical protein